MIKEFQKTLNERVVVSNFYDIFILGQVDNQHIPLLPILIQEIRPYFRSFRRSVVRCMFKAAAIFA